MKKLFTGFLAACLMLLVFAPQAKAIITDPDDYLIYDTGPIPPIGILPTAPDTFIFNAPGDAVRFFLSDSVSFRKGGSVWGRSLGDDHLDDMGWQGYEYTKSSTKVSVICINNQGDGREEKLPYLVGALNWKKIMVQNKTVTVNGVKYKKADLEPYRWWFNEDVSFHARPSDSLIVRVPMPCDSFVVQCNGANDGYGMIVYQREFGFDSGWWNGGNNGVDVATIGFKPTPVEGQDSVDIVIIPSHKDWFSNGTEPAFSHQGQRKYEQIPLTNDKYVQSERWGLFHKNSIIRIKVYGEVEPSVIPPFDGTIAGWDFKYLPKSSGTVDTTQLAGNIDAKTSYFKYASDLGVRRFVLTTDDGIYVGTDRYIADRKVAQLMINQKCRVDSLMVGTTHSNYLEFSGKADGCQEMTFNFDFACRSVGNEVTVLGLAPDSTNWEILGTYTNDDARGATMVTVNQPLPATYNNKKFALRVMVTGQSFTPQKGVSSLLVSNVSLTGFDDFYTKNDGAKKVAYITNATDRIHALNHVSTADSLDAFFKSIYTGADYDVKVFTQAETKSLTSEEAVKAAFEDFDLVIMNAYVPAAADIAKNAKYLIGYKPFLNLNVAASANFGLTPVDTDNDTLALVGAEFKKHPLFNGITLTEQEGGYTTPCLFSDQTKGPKFLQGITGSISENGYVLGKGGVSKTGAFVEDYTNDAAKFMTLSIAGEQGKNLNSKGTTLLKNAMNYLMTKGHFEIAAFELTGDGANVEGSEQFAKALTYNFSILGITNPVLYLKNSPAETKSLTGSFYTLGEMEVGSPFTIQPYEDAEITFAGTFIPVNTNVSSLTFKNVAFASAQPFKFTGSKQKLTGGLYFDNCRFANLETLLLTAGSDSCEMGTLSVKNSTIDMASAGSVLDVSDCFQLKGVTLSDNVWNGCSGKQFIKWAGTFTDTCEVSVTVEHNNFLGSADAGAFSFIDIKAAALDTCSLKVNNNIFYKTGAANITLPELFMENQGLNNVFEGGKADWTSAIDTISDLSFAGMGVEDPFAQTVAPSIEKSSPLYRAGVNRTYVGAKSMYIDRSKAEVVVVKNVLELKEAIEIAIDGDVIELGTYEMSETDTIDAYVLSDLKYPSNNASLTLRAAEGAEPKLIGNILGSSATLNDLTFEGLTWIVDTKLSTYKNETLSAAYLYTSNYKINGTLAFRNCNFMAQQKPLLRVLKSASGSYIGNVVYENCLVDNHGGDVIDGSDGGHLFQLDNSADYTLNRFYFKNNIVTDYHGGQVFNLSRSGSASANDSIMEFKIENNLFFRFGGASAGGSTKTANRFFEFEKAPANCHVDILIANNIFYERYASTGFPVADVMLFTHGSELSFKALVANNFYYGKYYSAEEETLGHNPVSRTDETGNLKQEPENEEIKVTYASQLDIDALGIDSVFEDIDNLTINYASPLYTAGLNGACLGPESIYVGEKPDALSKMKEENRLQVVSANGLVYVKAADDAQVEVFNLMGQSVVKAAVKAGVSEISGLAAGQVYLVRVGDASAKVMVK